MLAARWGDIAIITRDGGTATSLTTAKFLWLHEEAWDDGQKADFLRFHAVPAVGLYAAPAATRGKRRASPPQIFGRWLLSLPKGPSLACAEAQIQRASFASLSIYLSSPPSGWDEPTARASLTLLVSALILLSAADQVRLVPIVAKSSQAGASTLAHLGLGGEARSLWSPFGSMARLAGSPSGLKVTSLRLDPADWWALPFAAEDRKTLSYLERRIATAEKQTQACPAPSRRRRWGRLFW